jgi:hypothetical protein
VSSQAEPCFSRAPWSCSPLNTIASPVQFQNAVDFVGQLFHTMARVLEEVELFSVVLIAILVVDIQ